jgi:hypothetical protein
MVESPLSCRVLPYTRCSWFPKELEKLRIYIKVKNLHSTEELSLGQEARTRSGTICSLFIHAPDLVETIHRRKDKLLLYT